MSAQLLHGGEILTLSDEQGEAVLVENGAIAAIGSRDALLAASAFRDVAEIDLGGAVLMPGFVDGHAHLELSCLAAAQHLSLHAPPMARLVDICDAIARRRREQPEGWLIVRSSFALHQRVEEGRLPDRAELDRVSPDAPVVLLAGLHVAVLNSLAIELLGLDDPRHHRVGMTVHRRADGSLSGVFTEIWDLLPTASEEESEAAIRSHAAALFAHHGTTSMSTIPTSAADVRALHSLRRRGELPFRVRVHPHVPRVGSLDAVLSLGAPSGFGDDMLRFGGVKIFVDGEGGDGIGDTFDDLKWTQRELTDVVTEASNAGVQLFMHAVTTAGIRAAMTAVAAQDERVLARLPAAHRIEHGGDYVPRDLIGTLAHAGVGVVATPHFANSDRVGADFQPLRSLVDAGIRVIGATDSTGTVPEGAAPLANVAAAVTRRTDAGAPSPHRLRAEEALRMFTQWSAAGQGEGGRKGVIARGALADFAILDGHPLRVDPEQIANISVLGTVIGGEPSREL